MNADFAGEESARPGMDGDNGDSGGGDWDDWILVSGVDPFFGFGSIFIFHASVINMDTATAIGIINRNKKSDGKY